MKNIPVEPVANIGSTVTFSSANNFLDDIKKRGSYSSNSTVNGSNEPSPRDSLRNSDDDAVMVSREVDFDDQAVVFVNPEIPSSPPVLSFDLTPDSSGEKEIDMFSMEGL